MSIIAKSKFGDCSQCSAKNTACVKVKKDLVCLNCHRSNKGHIYTQRANLRDKERQSMEGKTRTEKKTIKKSVKSQVRTLISSPQNLQGINKSKLLMMADAAFSRYIIKRDTTKGQILCPCCRNTFDVLQVDKDGKKIVQNLHFINRGVYSQRFNEDNAHAGCGYCNLKMHLSPTGNEYQNYRQYLVNKLGEEEVAMMELEHRKINRIEETQLKNIIEHYT